MDEIRIKSITVRFPRFGGFLLSDFVTGTCKD